MRPPSRIGALVAAQRRAERLRLRIAAAAAAVVTVAAVGLLGLSGWFITGAALAGLGGLAAVQAFNYLMPSAVIRLLAILRTGARYAERVAGHEAALRALARLRPQLFAALASGSPGRALALSSGEASARLVQDVDAVQTLFVRLSAPWGALAGAAAAIGLTALANATAALLLALCMGASAAGSLLLARRLSDPAGRAAQIAVGSLKTRLSALESAAPELRAYGLETWAVEDCADRARDLDQSRITLTLAAGWLAVWQTAAAAGAVVLVTLAVVSAPAPLAALAILAALMGMDSTAGLASALHQNGAAAQAADRLDALAASPSKTGAEQAAPSSDTVALLGRSVSPPFRLAVVGASGVGKTTALERLIGLRDAPAGRFSLGGVDAADLDPARRRALFAYAAQDVRLMDASVRDNLGLAGAFDDETLWEALDDADLGDRFRRDPKGLGAPIGPDGARLSGGERRRLALARAYLRSAPWLVLDEPTEGLDAATEARVLAALDRRLSSRGQGLILVSHRLAPTDLCDAVVRLADERSALALGQGGQSVGLFDPQLVQ
ncbi:MAG: ATP-binding cassette domain-containing protein [Brevundimonas sp.]|uniref:ATP-binding cassette domain-containing protein n=1 Tax=Brevundimonas sp. TaxID=1871086 RepID=UPI0025827FD0|nr:ATP-binding cassette domain-containing protein [Brevundimonas sp.]MCV0415572.1 ATP-binding cassette domain-containing protein [Brevundimonas sp.]